MSDDHLFPGREAARDRSDAAWREFEARWAAVLRERAERVDAVSRSGEAARNPAELAYAEADLERQYRPMAVEAAEVAHRRDFPTRWGVRVIEWVGDFSLLVLYNNNPYDGYDTARDREREAFRRWMEEFGEARECGYAEYPATGLSEGYSYAMLVLTEPGFVDEVAERYFALVGTGLPDAGPPSGSEPEG